MSTPAPPLAPSGRPDEPPILDVRPSWAFILLRRLGWLIACVIVLVVGLAAFLDGTLPGLGMWTAASALVAALVIMFHARLERDGERYLLWPMRAVQESGIIRRLRVEAPTDKLQHAILYRSLRERMFGLGTIGLATAGSDAIEIVWRMIEHPDAALASVRSLMSAAAAAKNDARMSSTQRASADQKVVALPIIGLAGGIGAGKSTVARELEALGCLVIDSDQRAKAALDRPDVRDTLVGWWGKGILSPEGTVDRSKVASIIFSEPSQRERLEGLVHPIVRQDRAAIISEAAASNGRYAAVVVDAPLLFEAGLDKECDAVLFVDAPLPVRLARVQVARGWDEAELKRREAAQLSINEKRARSTHVIDNSGPGSDLRAQLAAVLTEIQGQTGGR
jgi:dephospho-CoA kinase